MLPDSTTPGQRADFDGDHDCWPQLLIEWTAWDNAEVAAARRLHPALATAERDGRLDQWFFVRKHPHWRLRHLGDTTSRTYLARTLEGLTATGEVAWWAHGIYEPETPAFGGATAMTIAHRLFHEDSRNILDYLSRQHAAESSREPGRRELGVLLISALLRGAGLDWHEQGDVWNRIAHLRRTSNNAPTNHQPPITHQQRQNMQRLMTADAARLSESGPLEPIRNWLDAFARTGRELAEHAQHGQLERGLRVVLAHHAIFAWNRLGLSAQEQRTLSERATEVIMTDHTTEMPRPPIPESGDDAARGYTTNHGKPHERNPTARTDRMVSAPTELIARAVIRRNEHILLAHQIGKAWSFLPGGHVEPGEQIETALRREIAEELGTTAEITGFVGAVEHGYTENEVTHHELNLLFDVTLDAPEPTSQEKHLEFHWIPLDQIAETNVRPASFKDALVTAEVSVPFWRGLPTGTSSSVR
ncbi:thiopeptide-type bacteriocin biosynthesis domain-containing protein [Actinopolyspora alba]|uniref:Thiopeptide-type bacteriocin biosynthesis domain-containing protein n=1 Tax=Actinopolyspora alba TaxID=673379 RepID=A0A1I2C7Q8_9ACTN|nr:thiopeptide-type bacteriocin biosynthesis protein [Actinopolyspora alba]SFE63853.1 thiopeptide-type bacteriocin biosynthesis domain-containing protein [Actinopolyspora alba]